MISYLKGIVDQIVIENNRSILILEVNNIGYEIQITNHQAREIKISSEETITIFTHFVIRDDQQLLYGFASSPQRDLFRKLISVSGVGSQSAIALIDTLGLEELVQSIVTGNIRMLSKAPGIGKKTAERLALELKTKLAKWQNQQGMNLPDVKGLPSQEILGDVDMTLMALGYSDVEIQQAIAVISQDNLLIKNPNVEEWIRSAIEYLSLNN